MTLLVNCQCGNRFNAPDKYAGQRVKCPMCSQPVQVPQLAAPSENPYAAPAPVSAAPARYSIAEFVSRSAERDRGQGLFELEHERLLEVNLNGMVWMKKGVMVAYQGNVKFTREGILEHGIGKFLKKSLTGEGTQLSKAEGQGKVYMADSGKKVTILNLQNEEIFINGNDVLAFEPTLKWDIKFLKKISSMLAGGLFNVKFTGTGMLAITSHYDPISLRVTPGNPVFTDPNATIAWSAGVTPSLKTDISLKTFFGRGSGESLQTQFDGDGFVVIQAFEEVYTMPS
jgi:uncharacterized protein (AIM24 family)